MQRTTTSNNSLANLYLLIILSLTYSAAHYWPILRYAMLFIIIGFGLPLLLSRKFFSTKMFWWWLVYIFVVAINVVIGDKYFDSVMRLLYEAAYLFIPTSMMYYAFSSDDTLFRKRSLMLFFVILVLTTIATAYIYYLYPGVIRHVFRYSEQENEGFYDSLYKMGLMKYSLPHALSCLIPVIILGLKNHTIKRFYRWMLWLVFFSLLLSVYYSGSFACMILTIGELIIALVVKKGNVSDNLSRLLVFAMALGIILTPSVRNSILDGLESRLDTESDFYIKIVELQEIEEAEDASEVEGDFKGRLILYSKSIDAGASSLLIGTKGESLGRHSSFLDRFGTLGIVGIIPYLLFLFAAISYLWNSFLPNTKVYYLIGLISNLFMLLFKSVNSWDFWFVTLFVLPIALKELFSREESHIVNEKA